ncbi:MAG: hypothetical protein PHY94_03960 [Candidatus Omnitrophica bacterium]|nr:hypothetical protein [Candidatus Omnitrophota bacterium]
MGKLRSIALILILIPALAFLKPAFSEEPRLPKYITTHFSAKKAGQFCPYEGKDADFRWRNLEKEGHPFNDNIAPAYNNYHNQNTAYNAISSGQIKDFEHSIFLNAGIHCDILNFNPAQKTGGRNYLLENHPNLQILNNIIYGSSLFTVSFPPYWSPLKSYPVVLMGQGYGSDNNSMYHKPNTFAHYTVLQAKLYKTYKEGFILVESNCGGREAVGTNTNALNDIGGFLKDVLAGYGADIKKVITLGGSRAGHTALIWGANPNGYAYNVLAIHAFVPPIKTGSMLGLSLSTYPSLTYVLNKMLNAKDAYSYSYKNLENNPPKILTREEKVSAACRITLSADTREQADSKSAFGYFSQPQLLKSLKTKRVLISDGTHDAYMPLPYLMEFDNLLKEEKVPHMTILGYCFGHAFEDPSSDYLNTLEKLVKSERITPFSESIRRFYMPKYLQYNAGRTLRGKAIRISDELIATIRKTKGYENYFPSAQDATTLGFSAAIPYIAVKGKPITIALIGEEGKVWKISCRKEDGYRNIYYKSGIFGASINNPQELEYGKEYTILQLNVDKDAGNYEWFFEYDGKEIPNRFTPFVGPNNLPVKAMTIVSDQEPSNADGYQYPLGDGAVNLGVDQYHPQLLIPNNPPVMRISASIDASAFSLIENTITLKTGQTLRLKLTATDPDGDELVYNIVAAPSNELLSGVDFNGLNGEFSYQARAEDTGIHLIKAIAKDGKGGTTQQVFRVEIK